MPARKSTICILFMVACCLTLAGLLVVHPLIRAEAHRSALEESRQLVRSLGLTDLCLFTEARYTRHLSQSDLNAPFQDHPFAFEHYPSGSLVDPPRYLLEEADDKAFSDSNLRSENEKR